MKVQTNGDNIKLWLSANDTYNWAHKAESSWPCSQLSNKRLFAEFDSGDLIDYTIDGKSGIDIDSTEFNAITSDFMSKTKVHTNKPEYTAENTFMPIVVLGSI